MKMYTITNKEFFTEEEARERLRKDDTFNECLLLNLEDNYSFMELFANLSEDFKEEIINETLDNMIKVEYDEVDI